MYSPVRIPLGLSALSIYSSQSVSVREGCLYHDRQVYQNQWVESEITEETRDVLSRILAIKTFAFEMGHVLMKFSKDSSGMYAYGWLLRSIFVFFSDEDPKFENFLKCRRMHVLSHGEIVYDFSKRLDRYEKHLLNQGECKRIYRFFGKEECTSVLGEGAFGRVFKALSLTKLVSKLEGMKKKYGDLLPRLSKRHIKSLKNELKFAMRASICAARLSTEDEELGQPVLDEVLLSLSTSSHVILPLFWNDKGYSVSDLAFKNLKDVFVREKVLSSSLFYKHNSYRKKIGIVQSVILSAAKGLKDIHDRGIAHRDVKGANLVVWDQKNWRVKYIDFELSEDLKAANDRFFQGALRISDQSGTPTHMAPELYHVFDVKHVQNALQKIDLYAFGLTCCEIILGQDLEKISCPVYYLTDHSVDVVFLKNSLSLTGLSMRQKIVVGQLLSTDPSRRPSIDSVIWAFSKETDTQSGFVDFYSIEPETILNDF